MLHVAAIFITLIILMILVFKKINIVIVSVLCAILLAILGGQDILTTMTDTFMTSAGNYVKNFFLLFIVSALFGKVMEETGAAASIAKFMVGLMGEKNAILGVIIAGAILCYGGISTLVIAFTMYPIALAMFQQANLPRWLIPGAIAAGCFTFAAAAFPGTPQTVNVIASTYLGTSLSAAPVLGIVCGIIGFAMIFVYMVRLGRKAQLEGDVFEADETVLETLRASKEKGDNVHPLVAILPIVVIIALLVVLKINVLVAMLVGTIVCAALLFKNLKDKNFRDILEYSVSAATNAAITTGAIVGYGAVVGSSVGFTILCDMLLSLKATPLLSYGLATTIISGAAGSGTGGLSIALEAMAPRYLEMGFAP